MTNLPIVSPVKSVVLMEPSEPVVFDVLLTDAEPKEPVITGNNRIWEESQKAAA
jgi:hypothetical protein